MVPILTTLLTAVGVSAGTAMTVATITSFVIAGIAIGSSVGSSIMDMIGIWCNIDNPTFKKVQTILSWTSMCSNLFYSVGSIYSGIKGITNSSLQNYSKSWIHNSEFRNAVFGARKYKFRLPTNQSTFWAGLGEKGADIAKNYATTNGRTSLEKTIEAAKIDMPKWKAEGGKEAWRSASASFAANSSGNAKALLGEQVGKIMEGRTIGITWLGTEQIILNVNAKITSIIKLTNYGSELQKSVILARTTQWNTIFVGGIENGKSGIDYILEKIFGRKENDD